MTKFLSMRELFDLICICKCQIAFCIKFLIIFLFPVRSSGFYSNFYHQSLNYQIFGIQKNKNACQHPHQPKNPLLL